MKSRAGYRHFPTINGHTACNLLEYLYQGGRDERAILELADDYIELIEERKDCSDFKVAYTVRILYNFGDCISSELAERFKQLLLGYPYDDCGGHGMCTWTENHRLYIDGSEYLLAQKYPDAIFADGENGAFHKVHAQRKLNEWFKNVERFGFCEWGSNNYYSETLAAISNVLELTEDERLRSRAKKAFELLLKDIFLRSSVTDPGLKNAQYRAASSDAGARTADTYEQSETGAKTADTHEQSDAGAKTADTHEQSDAGAKTAYPHGLSEAGTRMIFNPACARAYVDNKLGAFTGNYVDKQVRLLLGEKLYDLKDKEVCIGMLCRAKDKKGKPVFELPGELKILLFAEEKESFISQGVRVSDYKKYGLSKYSHENVRYAFESGVISDYRVIGKSLRYLCETGLIKNSMLKALSGFGKPIMYKTGLIGFIKRFVNVVWDSSAMEEGNVYTFVCGRYSVSAAFNYRVGKPLFQQNVLSVNLSEKVSLFANAPFKDCAKTGSPDYWIGSKIAPVAAAYRSTALMLFDTRGTKTKRTHLFFPTGLFDETDLARLSEGVLFGRSGGVNVCVFTNPGVSFIPIEQSMANDKSLMQDAKVQPGIYTREYDLMNESLEEHYYIIKVDTNFSFAEFKARMGRAKVRLDNRKRELFYSDEKHSLILSYKGKFMVDKACFEPKLERLGSCDV